MNEVRTGLRQPNSGNDIFCHQQDGVAVPEMPKGVCALLWVSVGAAHVMFGKSYCFMT